MTAPQPEDALRRYRQAKARRGQWESLWQECADFALPSGGDLGRELSPGQRRTDRIFDGTAPDAVEQLAASLLSELTPPWSRWFGLTAGPAVREEERALLEPKLEEAESVVQAHFDQSNFAVEMHQCFLELVTYGTACLLFEEAPLGAPSAFRFTAVPLGEAVLEEGPDGRLDVTFRRSELTVAQLRHRFPGAALPETALTGSDGEPRYPVLEAVIPDGMAYEYLAQLEAGGAADAEGQVLARGRFARSPFINFRWLKAPAEVYGRSPVMKALPDIKTANKVVELTLKNASIAVTGIWQADDDGVLNPAAVKLTPGTIIPKAVGSSGLTPLKPAGDFTLSEHLLQDLRARLRHALLVDQLGQVQSPHMTATEVLERSAQMARLLGASYGRLQSELLTPLAQRALAILRRRGEIAGIVADGRLVVLQHRSPLAQLQSQKDAQNILLWLQQLGSFGPDALALADLAKAARWTGETLGVPGELMRSPEEAEAAAGSQGLDGLLALAGEVGLLPAGEAADV